MGRKKDFDFSFDALNLGDDEAGIADAFDLEGLAGFDFAGDGDGLKTRIMRPRIRPPVPVEYKYAQQMAADTRLEKGEGLYAFVDGSFIFGDYLEALFDKGIRVDELYICTLSMSEDNVDSLRNILQTVRCKKLNVIVSHYFFSHERSRLIPYMYQELDHHNLFQLAVARVHCKIALIGEHDQGLRYVLHGSANLRSSMNVEQLEMIEDPALYAFNKRYLDNVIAKYKTIDKRRKAGEGTPWQQAADNTKA